jgi:hypothetical protein
MAARKLRNRMVHEYVRDCLELADALNEGHALMPLLTGFAAALAAYAEARLLLRIPLIADTLSGVPE